MLERKYPEKWWGVLLFVAFGALFGFLVLWGIFFNEVYIVGRYGGARLISGDFAVVILSSYLVLTIASFLASVHFINYPKYEKLFWVSKYVFFLGIAVVVSSIFYA